jgi:hypothetical protein
MSFRFPGDFHIQFDIDQHTLQSCRCVEEGRDDPGVGNRIS